MSLRFIYGAGGLGREVFYALLDSGARRKDIVFVDDVKSNSETSFLSVPLINFECVSKYNTEELQMVIAFGNPHSRYLAYSKVLTRGYPLTTVLDRTAITRGSVDIGTGSILSTYSVISDGSVVGKNCLINSGVIVGHDAIIGSHTSISSQVNVGGGTEIGERTFVGSGAKIRDGIKIGKCVVIGAGSIVLKDVPDDVVVLGNPAKIIAKNLSNSPFNN